MINFEFLSPTLPSLEYFTPKRVLLLTAVALQSHYFVQVINFTTLLYESICFTYPQFLTAINCTVLCMVELEVFVFYRSMYFDEDGDLAHEFYQQVVRNNCLIMERCLDNLIPQVNNGH